MLNFVDNALEQMQNVISWSEHQFIDYNVSYNIEHEINNYRTQLGNQNLVDINN